MREQEPSRTAFAAASHRAAHQVFEQGKIFTDPLALKILGLSEDEVLRDMANPIQRGMRLFIAGRTRFSEAKLAEGVDQRGVTQLVILGAGFDTFAYRSPVAPELFIFEIDHPATQAWKQRRLEETGIAVPANLAFTPVNFETDSLLDRLVERGFEPARRSFFLWLGVVPYLTPETVLATLSLIGSLKGGAEVAFDYSNPLDESGMTEEQRTMSRERRARVAALGEPFLSDFDTEVLHGELQVRGFTQIVDLGPREIIEQLALPFVPPASPVVLQNIPKTGGHILFAATG